MSSFCLGFSSFPQSHVRNGPWQARRFHSKEMIDQKVAGFSLPGTVIFSCHVQEPLDWDGWNDFDS
jgi:hypothetical protein